MSHFPKIAIVLPKRCQEYTYYNYMLCDIVGVLRPLMLLSHKNVCCMCRRNNQSHCQSNDLMHSIAIAKAFVECHNKIHGTSGKYRAATCIIFYYNYFILNTDERVKF